MKIVNILFMSIIAMPSTMVMADTFAINESRLERGKRLLAEIDGEAGQQVIDSLKDIAPDFGNYVFEYPFGDVYARPALDLRSREIATVAALTAMGNAQPQLKVHIEAALNVGVKPEEIIEIMIQMSVYAGFPAALNGLSATKEVFKKHNISLNQSDRSLSVKGK